MADTHQLFDSWYEIWIGPENDRRHFKRMDESSMVAEVKQLREQDAAAVEDTPPVAVNLEVFKVSINRELVSESEIPWQ